MGMKASKNAGKMMTTGTATSMKPVAKVAAGKVDSGSGRKK